MSRNVDPSFAYPLHQGSSYNYQDNGFGLLSDPYKCSMRVQSPINRLDDVETNQKVDARMNFPTKLYSLIREVEKGGRGPNNAIHWNQEGDAFVINHPEEFAKTMLSKFFRTGKFKSFQRQLCAYGFTRNNHYAGRDDAHMYQHEHFHRDHPDQLVFIRRRAKGMCSDVKRTKNKNNVRKSVESSKIEANQDALSPLLLEGLFRGAATNSFSLSDWDVEKETLGDDCGDELLIL